LYIETPHEKDDALLVYKFEGGFEILKEQAINEIMK